MKTPPHRFGMVAIIGPPNAGKSTLLNRLLRQKIAIVTPKPQTTRNRIMGIVTGAGYQLVLLDTPGLHEARETMNQRMVRAALQSLAEVDAVLFLADGTDTGTRLEQRLQEYQGYLGGIRRPVVLAVNKIDLLDPEHLPPLMDQYRAVHDFAAALPLAARTGAGVDALLATLIGLLPEGPQYYPEDIPTDASERSIAAEIIREKIFLLTRDEIPYATAVMIDSFEEGSPVVIRATILVERDSQKRILVGQKGRMLAAIRIKSEADIEHLLDCPVRLHLWIKVAKNWTENPTILRELGLW